MLVVVYKAIGYKKICYAGISMFPVSLYSNLFWTILCCCDFLLIKVAIIRCRIEKWTYTLLLKSHPPPPSPSTLIFPFLKRRDTSPAKPKHKHVFYHDVMWCALFLNFWRERMEIPPVKPWHRHVMCGDWCVLWKGHFI